MKPINFHPAAEVELADAAQYYEQSRAGLGVDFLAEVELALGQLTATPGHSRKSPNVRDERDYGASPTI